MTMPQVVLKDNRNDLTTWSANAPVCGYPLRCAVGLWRIGRVDPGSDVQLGRRPQQLVADVRQLRNSEAWLFAHA